MQERMCNQLLDQQLSYWKFDKYRTKKEKSVMPELDDMPVRFSALVDGVCFARELTAEPANLLYPKLYAERLLELDMEVEILDISAMGALQAAGQGSGHAPYAVAMTWKGPNSPEKPILVVGKGVCFDSGGLCIKRPDIQRLMKWDKAGAGAVAGLMKALQASNMSAYVVAIVGLIENMPDGKAIRPGDVITSLSGQTIEIADTDAEGRLVLADLLYYGIKRYQPELAIDLGTLTPEVFATLGPTYAGLYTDDDLLAQELVTAGKISGDKLWRLPMGESFAKQIESEIADIKNLGDEFYGESGACAEFLRNFVPQNLPWAHIDIAGVSWTKEKGPTGYGVRLLEEFIRRRT